MRGNPHLENASTIKEIATSGYALLAMTLFWECKAKQKFIA